MTVQAAAVGPRQQRSFPLIDALRGIAATMVLVYHVIEMGKWTAFPSTGALSVFRYGWTGVNLFLVISGFVIALTALAGYERDGAAFRKPFFRRRLARVLPLYLLTGLVYVVLVESSLAEGPVKWFVLQVLAHLAFVHNLFAKTWGTIDGPNWSVALEMQFYLVMVWLTPWLSRVPLPRLLVGALAGAALWRWLTTLAIPPGSTTVHVQNVAVVLLPGVIDHFVLGIVLARLVRGEARGWVAQRLRAGHANAGLWALLACALLAFAAWLLQSVSYWSRPLMITGMPLLLALGMASGVAAVVAFPHQRLRLLAPLRYLGTISYGIYLWHVLVILSVVNRYPAVQGKQLLLWVVLSCVALAMFSWHAMEKPAIERYRSR